MARADRKEGSHGNGLIPGSLKSLVRTMETTAAAFGRQKEAVGGGRNPRGAAAASQVTEPGEEKV